MVDFLCLGAQKSATTWLYFQLITHPSIKIPNKELHFWNYYERQDVNQWLSLFPERSDGLIQGECTPNYCDISEERIEQLAAVCPDVKLFAILRNPIDRCWSSARMFVDRKKIPASEIDQAYFHWIKTGDCLSISDYGCWIRRWRKFYKPEQLRFWLFDDIATRPKTVLTEIATYLNVDPEPFNQIPDKVTQRICYLGPIVPMPEEIKTFLENHFVDRVRDLEDYLQIDLTRWKTDQPKVARL